MPKFNQILFLDAETRWSRKPQEWCPEGYTLNKMTTEEYIRSPLFKAFGFGYKWLTSNTQWRPGDEVSYRDIHWVSAAELPVFFKNIDWDRTAVVCHNSQFDVAILSWHYGVRPGFIFDTLSMARALRGLEVGNSAAKLATDFGLPEKRKEIFLTDGLYDLPEAIERELAEYCKHDIWLAEQFFLRLCVDYPKKELYLIDLTIRMFTEPQLELDRELLQAAILEDDANRKIGLGRLGVAESDLASNDKFAEVLRSVGIDPPTKISKITGQQAYAFAKNDAMFQALLNSDDERVVHLCETRLKVKSTQERTRAQRFLDIASRGKLPVPVNYAHTRTLRWGAAKGSNINMQNLKRGGKLRKAIRAPEGHQCVAGDLSQIEPRVLAVLSDFTSLLEIFASGQDAYSMFGRQMFGVPELTKESYPQLRQSAKSALLGCFASDTQVLTRRGWKAIVSVELSDQLWDGQEWVQHTGVICQGSKQVFRYQNLAATEDHEILTERGWRAWSEVHTSLSLFQSALKLASLRALNGEENLQPKKTSTHISPSCAVAADGKDLLNAPISAPAEQNGAAHALRKSQRLRIAKNKGLSNIAQTIQAVNGYLRACLQSLVDARTKVMLRIQTTADAVSQYTRNGWKTGLSSLRISLLFQGGIGQNYSLTGSTIAVDMRREICDSALGAKTWQTNERYQQEKSKSTSEESRSLRQNCLTYDISNAGPRNRFTVLTDAGPIIVHNCGYGLGWANFATQLLTGFLGAPPVRYDKKFAKQLGIGPAYIEAFFSGNMGEERAARLQDIPHTCTKEELVIHAVCAWEIINRYRAASAPVVNFWEFLTRMMVEVLAVPDAESVTYKCLTFMPGKIILPNGLPIIYDKIESEPGPYGKPKYTYWNGKTRKNLYFGILAENVTSGTARCIIADGMLRVQRRYACAMPVHDEGVWCVPDRDVTDAKGWIKAKLIEPCPYLPGIPLDAEVGVNRSYGLAKA